MLSNEQLRLLCKQYEKSGLTFYAEAQDNEYKLWANNYPACCCKDEGGLRSALTAARCAVLTLCNGNYTRELMDKRVEVEQQNEMLTAALHLAQTRADDAERRVAYDILNKIWQVTYGQQELDNVCIRLAEQYGVLDKLQ